VNSQAKGAESIYFSLVLAVILDSMLAASFEPLIADNPEVA
jgi:hypothetical protein